jgi:hypothetical protein
MSRLMSRPMSRLMVRRENMPVIGGIESEGHEKL